MVFKCPENAQTPKFHRIIDVRDAKVLLGHLVNLPTIKGLHLTVGTNYRSTYAVSSYIKLGITVFSISSIYITLAIVLETFLKRKFPNPPIYKYLCRI